MVKITTLFKKDPNNLSRVIDEVNSGNEWVLAGQGVATRKFDGTAAAIINGELYKRYDVKKGRSVPAGAIPCQEPDAITGHWPHWVKCIEDNPEDRYFFEGLDNLAWQGDGTFELCGPKINGNPECFAEHELVRHGSCKIYFNDYSFDNIKTLLDEMDIEGIVFHHPDGRMCKIRKKDFGLKR